MGVLRHMVGGRPKTGQKKKLGLFGGETNRPQMGGMVGFRNKRGTVEPFPPHTNG